MEEKNNGVKKPEKPEFEKSPFFDEVFSTFDNKRSIKMEQKKQENKPKDRDLIVVSCEPINKEGKITCKLGIDADGISRTKTRPPVF